MLSRAVLVPLSSPKRLYLLLNNEQQLSTKLAEYRVEFVWLTDLSFVLVTLNKLHGILSAEIRERSYGLFITGSY